MYLQEEQPNDQEVVEADDGDNSVLVQEEPENEDLDEEDDVEENEDKQVWKRMTKKELCKEQLKLYHDLKGKIQKIPVEYC